MERKRAIKTHTYRIFWSALDNGWIAIQGRNTKISALGETPVEALIELMLVLKIVHDIDNIR